MPTSRSGPRVGFQNRKATGKFDFNWKDHLKVKFREHDLNRLQVVYSKFPADIEAMLVATATHQASKMLSEFISQQRQVGTGARGKFWTNRTHLAAMSWFTGVRQTSHFVRMFAAHGDEVFYAVYLEYGMDRRFESLMPMVEKYGKLWYNEVLKRLKEGRW